MSLADCMFFKKMKVNVNHKWSYSTMTRMLIDFTRIGGLMPAQTAPAILLQIVHRPNTISRLLMSTHTRRYMETNLPFTTDEERYKLQWISLCRGVMDAYILGERNIHIQIDNAHIVDSIVSKTIDPSEMYTKYYYPMLLGSMSKTDWTGIRMLV